MTRIIDIKLDGLSREQARESVIKLERKKEFVVDLIDDGRKVYIRTDGRKKSRVNGEKLDVKWDFTVHYDDEERGFNYVDDLLLDILLKRQVIGEDKTLILIEAIKQSIGLISIDEIYKKQPTLLKLKKTQLPGHSIDFLLKMIRWLALQEDVNYWGTKANGSKYEGREKPYNALVDLIVKKQSLFNVIKKHMLVPSFIR